VECGLQIPADENAKPVYVEYDGDLYWVNINRRGEIWINTREKPQPAFRIVPGKRLSDEESPESAPAAPPPRRDDASRAAQPQSPPPAAVAERRPASDSDSFLAKLRGLMRRNRRGHGWSGSFGFLTKALKVDEAGLLAQLGEQGLRLPSEGEQKPPFKEEGEFLYWLNQNQRGETWINARKARGPHSGEDGPDGGDARSGGDEPPLLAEYATPAPAAVVTPEPMPSPENTLAAVRLLLQPKKRGEGVAALVNEVATQLGRSGETLLAALAAAGVNLPADAKAKPTFGEHGGEIFWLNKNARGEVWLNAKPVAAVRKSRSRSSSDEPAGV
jgi:hypothetical protein